jgi:hypothetical protein
LLGYFLLNKVPSIHFSARFPNHFYLNTKHSLCVCVCVTLTKMPMTNKIVDQKRKRKNLVLRLCISSEPLIRRRWRGKEDRQSVLGVKCSWTLVIGRLVV